MFKKITHSDYKLIQISKQYTFIFMNSFDNKYFIKMLIKTQQHKGQECNFCLLIYILYVI